MIQRFGSREICDVTFKALNPMTINGHSIAKGQPVFVIDTAQTSNMEQASTVVYAQGGRGYNRLIAWEGEKTLTFNVTDALMSPIGLSMLTNAGIADAVDGTKKNYIHIHVTYDAVVGENGAVSIVPTELADELGIPQKVKENGVYVSNKIYVCKDDNIKPYATELDHNGGIVGWVDTVNFASGITATDGLVELTADSDTAVNLFTVASTLKDATIKLDFYVVMKKGATQITIRPEDFGGYFYVEADTLYRNEDGKDMAATLTFPKVKINSAFTITMAANGDPSTFDFQMDAMPAYTYFDRTHKVVCDITIVGGSEGDEGIFHTDEDHGAGE